jgi:two-component system OmpR family sensor kinase
VTTEHRIAARISARVEQLASVERVIGRRRRNLVAGASAVILAIAAVNATFDVALRGFYALPVVVVTVVVSTSAGALFAVLAGLAWTFDRAVTDPVPGVAASLNAVLRVAGFLLLVVLVSTLRAAVETARASDRRSRAFLGFAAHQLRTPIAGVRASAEALMLTSDPATRDELIAGIGVESARMGRLIASLLRIARLDQGELVSVTATDPRAIVTRELERARGAAPHLDVEARVDLPPSALLDGEAVAEIIGNLLDNARRHATRTVWLEADHGAGVLRVSVADDGPGVVTGSEEQVFERFVTLDGGGGVGLGLPIARALAEAHGGTVTYAAGTFVATVPAPLPVPPG